MTLPSQAARTVSNSASRFNSSSRRAGSPLRRLVGAVVLIALVLGFGWWAVSARRPATPGIPGADAASQSTTAAIPPADTKSPADAAVKASDDPVSASEPTAPTTTPAINRALIAGSMTQPVTTPPVSTSTQPQATTGEETHAPPFGQPGTTGAAPDLQPRTPDQPAAQEPPASSAAGGSLVSYLVSQGDALAAQGKPVEAREVFNHALNDTRADENDRRQVREKMAAIADSITFSQRVEPGDAMCMSHPLGAGENLVKLANGRVAGVPDLKVDWRFLQRINKIADPNKLRQGQNIKLVKGPFHAVVNKGAFRLDLFADIADSEGHKVFLRSYPVGLGAEGSTPIGTFIVRPKSKLVNPRWVNPRTGEKFDADDPKNPIGERWIGLQGTDKNTEMLSGYGIHGTIAPDSIGHEASMGCVRMLAPDVEVVFELMSEGSSTVEIRP